MTDDVVFIVAAAVTMILLIALFKALGNVVKALVIALIAGGLLYALLPKLGEQEGAIGDAARKAIEVTGDLEGSVRGLRDRASETTQRVSDGISQMEEAAEAVERANDALKPSSAAGAAPDRVPRSL